MSTARDTVQPISNNHLSLSSAMANGLIRQYKKKNSLHSTEVFLSRASPQLAHSIQNFKTTAEVATA